MQLLWHCVVNLSFGFLVLLAVTRIAQELLRYGSSLWRKTAPLKCVENGLRSVDLPALKEEPGCKP